MSLSLVFFAFLARTAVGTFVSLLFVMGMRPAERHVRFQCVLATVLAAGAAALYLPGLGADTRPEFPRGMEAFLSFQGAMPWALVLLAVLGLVANFLFGVYRRGAARAAVVAAVVVGAVATFGTARIAPGDSAGALAGRTASGFLGGWLMGGVNDAMILGHFYLMIKGLPLEALKRTGIACAVAILLRTAGVGLTLLLWPGATDVLFGREVIWTSWRIVFGLFGPLALVWMTRDALKYRHTQAATGILYVAVFFALMGELAAVWLETRTGFAI